VHVGHFYVTPIYNNVSGGVMFYSYSTELMEVNYQEALIKAICFYPAPFFMHKLQC